MNEMIERVMMAIQLATPYIRKELAEQAAIAAIAAMREPTDAMMCAIFILESGKSAIVREPLDAYQAMIDAALSK